MPNPPLPYFLVYHGPGPNWDPKRSRREQEEWEEHAAFMDALAEEGVIVLGGPVDPTHAVIVVRSADEREAERRLAEDPWKKTGILQVVNIARWEILLDSRARS